MLCACNQRCYEQKLSLLWALGALPVGMYSCRPILEGFRPSLGNERVCGQFSQACYCPARENFIEIVSESFPPEVRSNSLRTNVDQDRITKNKGCLEPPASITQT